MRHVGLKFVLCLTVLFFVLRPPDRNAATLEESLLAEGPQALVDAARESGDAIRGAIVFHQPHMSCAKCHLIGQAENPLGPDLTHLPEDADDVHVVESLLQPSKTIRKGYEPVRAFTIEGIFRHGTPRQGNRRRTRAS